MVLILLVSARVSLCSINDPTRPPPVLMVPRLARPPVLEDFLTMKPNREVDGKLAKIEGFIQREPSDGEASTQRTEVYVGYDEKNLYVIFVAFDSEPARVRARMTRREDVFEDDTVEVMLDTFNDQRRAYVFVANPLGIQWDALFTEAAVEDINRGEGRDLPARDSRSFDNSFDTLWHSRGRLTHQGFVVWMAIPFKSLRFPPSPNQTWRILFVRDIQRNNETSFWPHVSSRIEGRLNQAALLRGLEHISPGRNMQFIPFGVFRSFRALDTRNPNQPRFVRDRAEPDAGLDAKFVFKDSLVLDVAVNPDFSQVESDDPQVTVNQRFEVFFPEKRPFFLENANFFQTPVNLLFTRRIADPQFGVRLTGRTGPYTIGALLIDDESPGKLVPPSDPLHGKRAVFAIARFSRDIFQQSSLGFIYTGREFENIFNRVGGFDGRLKLNRNWVLSFQALASSTRCLPPETRDQLGTAVDGCFSDDPVDLAGPAYDVELSRSGRQLLYSFAYNNRSPGFRSGTGFVPRTDIHQFAQRVNYRFRPEGKYLISWGPNFNSIAIFDHSGRRLDLTQDTFLSWELVGQTEFGVFSFWDRERLRPSDFPVLPENRDFARNRYGFFFNTSYIPQVTFSARYNWGTIINFSPPEGQEPFLADVAKGEFRLTVRPVTELRIDNTYLLTQLFDRASRATILNNNILRSRWNWQFNRELSLRVILEYDSVLTNPGLTDLETSKNLNADILLTYLVNPWTALFVGYNSNAQNLELSPTPTGAELIRPRRRLINDAKQFFVKFSYLIRF